MIHAASCDWEADRPAPKGKAPAKVLPHQDLRYYARGAFTWPQITSDWALGGKGFLGKLKVGLLGLAGLRLWGPGGGVAGLGGSRPRRRVVWGSGCVGFQGFAVGFGFVGW